MAAMVPSALGRDCCALGGVLALAVAVGLGPF
jgi:hypothetical protein